MNLDPQTGEPSEIGDREQWWMKVSVDPGGLLTEVHHLTSTGPETGGHPVFVSKDELQAFIRRYSPATNVFAQADLIARTAWEAPAGADAAGLADLPGGEWITLPRVLNFLAFGKATPPDGDDPPVTLERQRQAFRAMLERARIGKIKMDGTCSTGGAPQGVPPSIFAQDLVPTENLDGFDIAASERMDDYAAWRNEKTRGTLWHNVTVSRASLNEWFSEFSGQRSEPAEGSAASAGAPAVARRRRSENAEAEADKALKIRDFRRHLMAQQKRCRAPSANALAKAVADSLGNPNLFERLKKILAGRHDLSNRLMAEGTLEAWDPPSFG